jgi:hypothetical protein
MQFWSFDPRDPIFDLDGWRLSVQITTLENTYGLAQEHCAAQRDSDGASWTITCDALSWAGQQQQAAGSCTLHARKDATGQLRISIRASAPHKIRCIKLIVRDLPEVVALDMHDQPEPMPERGWLMEYPSSLRTPLLFVRETATGQPNVTHGFRCEDAQVRAKRFAVYREPFGPLRDRYAVELIAEADARHFDETFAAPDWVLGRDVNIETFREDHLRFLERHHGLLRWGSRADVPAWFDDVALCLNLHGMHWSGYIFNTYAQMAETLAYAAARIAGKHILAYLPGWEGRYYWQYGDYRPEPLLGGEAGFAQLCDTARALGVHLMPMFGGNCANAWFSNFHAFGPDAHMKSATRNRLNNTGPDWDMARTHDTGWQAWLNPGHPSWQTELCRQILRLHDQFGFDAIFLDTIHVWSNDPDYSVFQGNVDLARRLREGRPELLVAAEHWYDAMLGVYPLFQNSGHWMAMPEWSSRYVRHVAHLFRQEPSRGSTGVHEMGYTPYALETPHPGHIPTVAFVDGTLAHNAADVDAVIAHARARLAHSDKTS